MSTATATPTRRRAGLAALAVIAAGAVLAATVTPAAALAGPPVDAAERPAAATGGSLGANRISPSLLAGLARTPVDGQCSGLWFGSTATVQYRRNISGRLDWNYFISNQTRAFLGPIVTVSMPFAYLNGIPINPPYAPHTEPNTYDFHGSVNYVQYIGGGNTFIQTGDILTMYWYMVGSNPGRSADHYLICQIPAPGVG